MQRARLAPCQAPSRHFDFASPTHAPPSHIHTRTPDTGHRTPDTGHRTPDTGHRTPDTGHRTPDTGHRTPDTGHRTCEGSGKSGGVKACQRREALPMNGARGTVVAVPPFVPAVPEASGFHSREVFCLPREAKGLGHPSPGQGRLGGRRPSSSIHNQKSSIINLFLFPPASSSPIQNCLRLCQLGLLRFFPCSLALAPRSKFKIQNCPSSPVS